MKIIHTLYIEIQNSLAFYLEKIQKKHETLKSDRASLLNSGANKIVAEYFLLGMK